jgi:predicted SnoaL-like aldol condensation-catalyzing enzyme
MSCLSRIAALSALLLVIAAGPGAAYAQVPPVGVSDQAALLKSSDPRLAANKKLVYDMYRAIIEAGRTDLAEQYFTPEYIQHNPNVASGRDELVAYIKKTRPVRPLQPAMGFPLIAMMAEGDLVLVAIVNMAPDPEKPDTRYANTHFDLYRIENGKIAEHWDHVPKSKAALSFDPNVSAKP